MAERMFDGREVTSYGSLRVSLTSGQGGSLASTPRTSLTHRAHSYVDLIVKLVYIALYRVCVLYIDRRPIGSTLTGQRASAFFLILTPPACRVSSLAFQPEPVNGGPVKGRTLGSRNWTSLFPGRVFFSGCYLHPGHLQTKTYLTVYLLPR